MKTISGPELARRTGASYRQIDYWCRNGVICPLGEATPGSGRNRQFKESEVKRVRVLADISKVFGYKGIKAEHLKKIYRNYNRGRVNIGHGIIISWEVE